MQNQSNDFLVPCHGPEDITLIVRLLASEEVAEMQSIV